MDSEKASRLVVQTCSRHALERFRLHHPEATSADAVTAASLALPIDAALAHAVTGRPRAAAAGDDVAEHRLHPEGTGLFVVCPLPALPGRGYVRTYLRLGHGAQQSMVRAWLLDPLPALREAFLLGFRAAQAGAAQASPQQAYLDHAPALLRLGPSARGLADLEAGPPPGPAAERASDRATPPTPRRRPLPPVVGVEADDAVRRHLGWFAEHHPDFEIDVRRWLPLPPAAARLLGPQMDGYALGRDEALWLEPRACAAGLMEEAPDAPPRLLRLVTVPRAHRPALLAGEVPPPPAAPLSPASSPPPPAPPPASDPTFVAPDAVRVRAWTPVALREAAACALHPFEPQWLDLLDPVPPARVAELAARLGWRLRPDLLYAARTTSTHVLLIGGRSADLCSVLRCSHRPDPAATPSAATRAPATAPAASDAGADRERDASSGR